MTPVASAVRAVLVALPALLAAPDAQADASVRFGFGRDRLAHESRLVDKPGIGQRHAVTGEHGRDHAVIEERRFDRRHRFDDPPHSGSGLDALDRRHAFFHDHRFFRHRRPHLRLHRPGQRPLPPPASGR